MEEVGELGNRHSVPRLLFVFAVVSIWTMPAAVFTAIPTLFEVAFRHDHQTGFGKVVVHTRQGWTLSAVSPLGTGSRFLVFIGMIGQNRKIVPERRCVRACPCTYPGASSATGFW